MNIRKLSILFACMGLSAMAFGCGEDAGAGFIGELIVCDPQTELSRCDEVGNMEICATVDWKTEICEFGCKDGACVIPEGAECVVTMCDADGIHLNECSDGVIVKKDCSANGQICLGNTCADKPVTVDCRENDIKCVGDNTYLTCSKDGTWLASENTCEGDKVCSTVDGRDQCIAVSDIPKCDADVCVDGMLQVCDRETGVLGEAQACPSKACDSGNTCAPVSAEPEIDCAEGDKKCSDDGKGIISCTAEGKWGEAVACEEEGYVCDATLTCVAPDAAVECVAEQIQCADDVSYKTCMEGKWSAETTKCADETPVCNVDKCEAAAEEPPVTACAAECDGDKIKECDENGNLKEATDCPNGGKCVVEDGVALCKLEETVDPLACTPGAVLCGANAKLYQVCQEDGTWGASQACEGEKVCDASVAEICVAQCTAGEERCLDGVHQVCSAQGAWTDDACGYAETCSAETGACVCTADATKCEENDRRQVVLKTCQEDGTWDNGTQCRNGQYCDTAENKCVDSCTQNSERCTADGTHQVCGYDYMSRSYIWQDSACAANETCHAESGACVCTEGATKCVANGNWNVEYLLSTCQADGTWDDGISCEDNKVCDPSVGECVAACTDGEVKCEGASFMRCSDGIWAELTNCGAADACDAEAEVPGCNCELGDTICVGDSIMECSNLQAGNFMDRYDYKGYASTENTQTCDAGMCKTDESGAYCACAASSVSCDNGTLSYCGTDGKMASVSCGQGTCNETLAACIARNAGVCSGTEKACLSNNIVSCSNGLYVIDEACGEKVCTESGGMMKTYSCEEANANEQCQNNAQRCSADGNSVENCSNRKWQTTACETDEICVESTSGNGFQASTKAACQAKVCAEMAMACGSGDKANVIQICHANAWTEIATCADGMTCLAGSCVVN